MKRDAQLVMNYVKRQDISKLHFMETDWGDKPAKDQSYVKNEIIHLKRETEIGDRIVEILRLNEDFATFDEKNKYQCRADANRSAVDIWRLYNYYFRPVSIFTIMRALYKLVVMDEIETLYCHDIDKQVFMIGSDTMFENTVVVNELGVRFAEWRRIGL